jgi:hypothetical protein
LMSYSKLSTPFDPGSCPSFTSVLAASSITPMSLHGNKTRSVLRYREMLVVVLTTSPLTRHSEGEKEGCYTIHRGIQGHNSLIASTPPFFSLLSALEIISKM